MFRDGKLYGVKFEDRKALAAKFAALDEKRGLPAAPVKPLVTDSDPPF